LFVFSSPALAIRCYHCEDCATVSSQTTIRQQCTNCKKNDTYFPNGKHMVSRYCRTDSCTSVNRVMGGVSTTVNCCYSDLCNSAPVTQSTVLHMLLVTSILVVTRVFM
ncbi:CD59 molecule complement regulatory protein, partial [Fasciolopsis buskii]